MRQLSILCGPLLFALLACTHHAGSQTDPITPPNPAAYRLSVSVDEVLLTFHAADAHGLPVNDLKLDEVRLLDNGKPPAKVLAFELLHDVPSRAGILIDTSESMRNHISGNREIANQYAQQIVPQQTDQVFVADFVRRARILQSWSDDGAALTAAIGKVSGGAGSLSRGTAIFDTLYHACEFQFGVIDHAASGNFILLFSDGEDNASDMHLQDAVDACQRANTAIYAFRAESEPGFSSSGPATLAQLAAQTGGRVFRENDSEAGVSEDLRIIEADLRNQYRLIYKPAELQHDGSFHQVAILPPSRVDQITVRSGYYAPSH
jgi:Ca-activated chloride channel family protein